MVTESKEVSAAAISRSVIDRPTEQQAGSVPQSAQALLWFVADAADEITPWGRNHKLRDRQLREFWTSESYFASSLGIVAARNSAFSWTLAGPKRLTAAMQDVLDNANAGEGWQDLITKTTIDLSTQDNGAFWEIVREADSPDANLIAVNHLDAWRCWHTGVPEAPVLYQDRRGRYHLLRWYQVVTLSEMPSPIEGLYGLQFCALSRLLKAAHIIRNINTYLAEKTGGRNNRAIHLLAGITGSQITDALEQQGQFANSAGLMRYVQPLIVASVDPKASIDVKTLELASLPDSFDQEVTWKHYIAIIAMAFLSDFQEFAPLPGGNLGTSAQSEVLHMKTRGKGPALFMKMITHALNFKVLPAAVEFEFQEQDLEAEQAEATIRKTRAEERDIRIKNLELEVPEARQLAMDAGDLPQELFDRSGGLDMTAPGDVLQEGDQQPAQTPSASDTTVEDQQQNAAAQPQGAKAVSQPRPFRFKFEDYI